MTYKKPNNVTYTQMCMWIDENAYKDNCDQQKMFEYIYHIILMLARQNSYFNNSQYYDDFALQAATRVFLRYQNPKQFEQEDGQAQLPKIKSVLNYIKSIIYPMKVDFQQDNFIQNQAPPDIDIQNDPTINFKNLLQESVDELNVCEFVLNLNDIVKTSRAFLKNIPYKHNSSEWYNIYTSCMLSLLNSVTLNNKSLSRIKSMGNSIYAKPEVINKLYKAEQEDFVILYHLDDKMHDYIKVLTTRLRHAIAKDLTYCMNKYVPTEISIQNLMLSITAEDEN